MEQFSEIQVLNIWGKKCATYISFQMDHSYKCVQLKTHLLVSDIGVGCL